MSYLYVFLGGGLGSVCRFALAHYLPGIKNGFPYATLLANVLACLILGAGIALVSRELLATHHRLLLLTGFCGGFSTFSTFSAELIDLYSRGDFWQAGLYGVVSLTIGVLAVLVGLRIAGI